MYFQISPIRCVKQKNVVIKKEDEEIATLTLAPFTPTPKLSFQDVPVNSSNKAQLIVKNPRPNPVSVGINFDGPDDLELSLNWCEELIDGSSEKLLVIFWIPKTEYSARHSLKVSCQKQCFTIPITFKSLLPKKPNQKKKSKVAVTLVKKSSPLLNGKKFHKTPEKRPVWNSTSYKPPKNSLCGKENTYNFSLINSQLNSELSVDERRLTYAVHKIEPSPKFDDSLEFNTTKSIAKSPEFRQVLKQIRNNTPTLEELLQQKMDSISFSETPRIENFKPRRVSTEKRENFDISFERKCSEYLNISAETRILSNSSCGSTLPINSDTFTKRKLSIDENIPFKKQQDSRYFERSLSPITFNESPKNYVDLTAIREESGISILDTENLRNRTKRKSDCTFTVSPVKRQLLSPETWSKIGANSRLQKDFKTITCYENTKKVSHVETKIFTIKDPFILAATTSIDPFLTNTIQLDDQWIQEQELRFKKWFNTLLTPPSELKVEENEQNIDVVKIWTECSKKEVLIAPTKEVICNNYHTKSKLDILRKSALELYMNENIQLVLNKVSAAIEAKKLEIRRDRNVHLDLSLQSKVMSLILSYNPLWLRIGLETIYKEKIELASNSDILGLSKFIYCRFFKDPKLFKKYKTIHNDKYTIDIKKFMLKKYLDLVYFLDNAKNKTLIGHDPCLFRRNSSIKESREMLVQFTKDAITAGVGDINKYLKYFGYVVTHKQLYIHEFDYAVNSLGGDLRDGVRLTRVMEIILLQNNLIDQLRVPAISRLQKIHNVKIVFKSLEDAGYKIQHEIEPFHIVDGHRERTLSFLWQIIYKFQAPLMIKTVEIIQKWWRSFPVCIKRQKLRKIYNCKMEAATKIQRWYRRQMLAEKITAFSLILSQYIQQRKAAIKIQSYIRMYIVHKQYIHLRNTVVKLQKQCRKWLQNVCFKRRIESAIILQKNVRSFITRSKFLKLKKAVLFTEEMYKAKKLMIQQKQHYEKVRSSTIVIQKWFTATLLMKKQRYEYLQLKHATHIVQEKYRNKILTRKTLQKYQNIKFATITIQNWYRSVKLMHKHRTDFLKMKNSALTIEKYYIANREMKKARNYFVEIRTSVILIQRYFRATIEMRKQQTYYKSLKNCVKLIETRYKAKKSMLMARNNFQNLRSAVIIVQRRFKAMKMMNIERNLYMQKRTSAIIIQNKFRSYLKMRKVRKLFIEKKSAAVIIQQKYRAYKAMSSARLKFRKIQKAAICIQTKYRSNKLMKEQRHKFLVLKNSCIKIQGRLRSYLLMKKERRQYLELRASVCFVQEQFRANKLMQISKKRYNDLKQATIFAQRRFRANKSMKIQRTIYTNLKNSVIFVQSKYKANKMMLAARNDFQNLKRTTLFIQTKFRANILMRIQQNLYKKQRNAAITIQKYWRNYLSMKKQRQLYVNLRNSAIVIQHRFRAHSMMLKTKKTYEKIRESVVFIQRKYKANKMMKIQRNSYLQQKRAAILIQNHFKSFILMKKDRKKFVEIKRSTIIIQKWYLACKEMLTLRQNYETLRKTVIIIQRKFRSIQLMRKCKTIYLQKVKSCIIIQRYFRGFLLMKQQRREFLSLKTTVKFIQDKYRAKKSMEVCRKHYCNLKTVTITIQRKFRANKQMKIQRSAYVKQKEAAIKIQKYFKGYQQMKIDKAYLLSTISAIISIQRFVRGFLIRKKYGHLLTAEAREERKLRKLQEAAAVKIQALWKGYSIRKRNAKELKLIQLRFQCIQNVLPEKTLGSRCEKAMELFASENITLPIILFALQDFEYATRRSKELCRSYSSILPEQMFMLIKSVARSLPEIEICVLSTYILINFHKYQPTSANTWCPEHLEGMISVMMHWCDKEEMIFPALCTLLWLFAHNDEYKRFIWKLPQVDQKLDKIQALVTRKQKMVSKSTKKMISKFSSIKSLPKPGLKPDWGFDYPDRPRTFTNSVHAMNCLFKILKST